MYRKDFLTYFHEVDADIFCIQESKLQEGQITLDLPGYFQHWNYAAKKATPAQFIFLPKKNLFRYTMALNSAA